MGVHECPCMFQGNGQQHYIWKKINMDLAKLEKLTFADLHKEDYNGLHDDEESDSDSDSGYELEPSTRIVYIICFPKDKKVAELDENKEDDIAYKTFEPLFLKNKSIPTTYLHGHLCSTSADDWHFIYKKLPIAINCFAKQGIWKLPYNHPVYTDTDKGPLDGDEQLKRLSKLIQVPYETNQFFVATVNPQPYQFFIKHDFSNGKPSFEILHELLSNDADSARSLAKSSSATWGQLYSKVLDKYGDIIDYFRGVEVYRSKLF